MPSLESGAALLCGVALAAHLATVLLAAKRCRADRPAADGSGSGPAVSVLRPVRGLDHYDELTLGSSFALAYPDYEIVFCCADADDPVVPLISRLMAAHPRVRARLLIGDDRQTANPKLNNLIKGWAAARHDWIVIADSNVLMPRDYIQRLLGAWRRDTGLVCSPPVGCRPNGFCAELEIAFLNTYQARWQYAADSVGFGFTQGKTMLWRREDLDASGGIVALGREIAEDAAATKIVRATGQRVRLVDRPFEQPLGLRTLRQVWDRQLRWARLRRATFPVCFVPEILTGILPPLLAAAVAAIDLGLDISLVLGGLVVLWYGAEAVLAWISGWPISRTSPAAWMLRDLLLPVLWLAAWLGNSFTWRGNEMNVNDAPAIAPDATEGIAHRA